MAVKVYVQVKVQVRLGLPSIHNCKFKLYAVLIPIQFLYKCILTCVKSNFCLEHIIILISYLIKIIQKSKKQFGSGLGKNRNLEKKRVISMKLYA